MTPIIKLAHKLGETIAESDEIRALAKAKAAYEADGDLQAKLNEYEAERRVLADEFSKAEEADEQTVSALRARLEELGAVILANPHYTDFSSAQKALNDLMAEVNAEIKFCITGERPSACTHDCSTCGGCHQ